MPLRVLVSRLSAMGDVVCSLPVASAVRAAIPDAEVVWIVDKRFKGIVECCTAVSSVVERPSDPRAVRNMGRFDVAFDLQGLLKSALLTGLADASRKLGYHWQREGAQLFSSAVLPDPSSHHVVDQYVDVARAAGFDADRAVFSLEPKEEDVTTVKGRLEERGMDGRAFVLVNAGAAWATKRWDPEKFAALSDGLASTGVAVVFCGAKADASTVAEVRRFGAAGSLDMTGATNVRELVALVSLAAVHVGGDTGTTHIAAALGRPAVGLYTLTRPERSCPYGQIDGCYGPDATVKQVLAAVTSRLTT
ncbi:MAG: glycosyltransferase family 9 protein [Armatimonadetes bacterium]|nr:glycosyltransferase family 9 protein [Armatimonadota bacterium]